MKQYFLTIAVIGLLASCHKTTSQNMPLQVVADTSVSSVEEYEIDSTFWIERSDGSCLRSIDTFFIRELQEAVAAGDKKHVAKLINYPFERGYPLKPIMDEAEFIANYDRLLPIHIRERITQSTLDDWTFVGWRGTILDNGLLWFDYYDEDTKIKSIGYD